MYPSYFGRMWYLFLHSFGYIALFLSVAMGLESSFDQALAQVTAPPRVANSAQQARQEQKRNVCEGWSIIGGEFLPFSSLSLAF